MLKYLPRATSHWRVTALAALAVLLIVSGVSAAPGQLQSVERPRAVGGAGGTSVTVNGITLRGTLGQPFVGVNSSDNITLGHGFWHGTEAIYTVYLPLVLREY